MVQYAALREAIVVSNDKFRDLLGEDSTMDAVINRRLLPFTFMSPQIVIFPQDPFGCNSRVTLDEMLRF